MNVVIYEVGNGGVGLYTLLNIKFVVGLGVPVRLGLSSGWWCMTDITAAFLFVVLVFF